MTGWHSSPDREAFRYPAGEGQPWTSKTWKETGDTVEKIAAGLLALGIQSEQRVGIASGTRVEWIFADLAVMSAGGATTTVYPSTMAEDVAYILSDSECRVVFAEDDDQVAKLKAHKSELPHLEKVVVFDGSGGRGLGDHPRRPDARSVRSTSPRTPTPSPRRSTPCSRTTWPR